MIKEFILTVKCPATNKDIDFKFNQHSNGFDWLVSDTSIASGKCEIWGDVSEAVKNILTLSPNN